MAGVEDRSEFEGGGLMPNTIFPKGADALSNSDKLRLQSITGQEDDPNAAPNEFHWNGNVRPNPMDARLEAASLARKRREIWTREKNRYRESPY